VVKAIETGCRAEMEKTTPNGRTWIIHAAPIRDEEGRIVGGAEIALDVTRYKQTEQALSEIQHECRQLETELDACQGRARKKT
jgi:hypothetical protein